MTATLPSRLPSHRLIAEFSVWSANLGRIETELKRIEPHADILHIDVADGHFAPAMLFFPDLVAVVRKHSTTPIHVHLMVADSILLSQVNQFADAGADLISVHVENRTVADQALELITRRGLAAGMVLRVETPVEEIERYVSRLEFVTLLGTAIGVKGQDLDPKAGERLLGVRTIIDRNVSGRRVVLAADGGIREHTVPLLHAHGAETVVLGSLAFNAPSLADRMEWLKSL